MLRLSEVFVRVIPISLTKERRLTARIEAPFPARLKGVDSTGRVFTEYSVLDNLSNG